MAAKSFEIEPTGRNTSALRSRRKQQTNRYLLWSCIGIAVALMLHSLMKHTPTQLNNFGAVRGLLSSGHCPHQPKWIKNGGVVLYFIGICFMFLGISIICDEYFVDSLTIISNRLNLSEDISGATFMAAGSSAPELFASFVALLNDNASNDIGVGTIVGSAVFNILVIIGVSTIFSGLRLTLDYRPVARDCFFYALAIGGIALVFHDGKIYWWEGLISVFLYGVYIVALKFNKQIMSIFPIKEPRKIRQQVFNANGIDIDSQHEALLDMPSLGSPSADKESENEYDAPPVLPTISGEIQEEHPNVCVYIDQDRNSMFDEIGIDPGGHENVNGITRHADINEASSASRIFPENLGEKAFRLVSLPWNLAFHYTVPDCSKARWETWYAVTFVASVIWIGVISWFMVEWTQDIGCALGVPSSIMGVTVLAAGTSIPDALSSISVAQEGKGDMAAANAVGSNVFDIWLGLGLPWLLVIPFKGKSGSNGTYIEVDNTELLPSILILFGVLTFYILFMICTQWTLNRRHGYAFVALYVVYALYYIIAVWVFDIFHDEDKS